MDAVVYKAGSHLLEEANPQHIASILIYTFDSSRILGTLIAGKWVVKDQHHVRGQFIKDKFIKTMRAIRSR